MIYANKICVVCGKEFTPKVAVQKCCNYICSEKREKQMDHEWYLKHIEYYREREKTRYSTPEGKRIKSEKNRRYREKVKERKLNEEK